MFIAKPKKCDYNEAKTSCPISLLSFLLKKMQKLADRHIKDYSNEGYPLHQNQFAYQTGKLHFTKSGDTHCVAQLKKKEIASGAFLAKSF
jgi:hypothetical protein